MITPKMLSEMRQSSGITQREMAAAIKISQAHISKIENGKVDPRLSTVNKIISILSKKSQRTCKDIMTRQVKTITFSDPVKKAINIMHEFGISQLPVIQDGQPVGMVSEADIVSHLDDINKETVGEIMGELPPVVSPSTSIDMVRQILKGAPAVLVFDKGKLSGVVTHSDLMRLK